MTLEKKITGLWSVDNLYAPGAMEDILVVFLPSGEGWLYFTHPCQNIVEKFIWNIDPLNLLHVRGTTSSLYYDVDEDHELAKDSYFDKNSDVIIHEIKVEVSVEFTPRGENEVISFSKPLWGSDDKFALVHRDFDRIIPPSFDL